MSAMNKLIYKINFHHIKLYLLCIKRGCEDRILENEIAPAR